MNIPGFTADSSIYVTKYRYLTAMQGLAANNSIDLAGTCTCSDAGCDNPTCTCSCPIQDPCDICDRLKGCNRLACLCRCNGGRLASGGLGPCPFHCVDLP